MAVRTAYAPVASTVLTAANLAKLAGGWVGYAQATSSQAGLTTTTDITSLTVAPTIGTGRQIRITVQIGANSTAASQQASLSIQEGATILGQMSYYTPATATGIIGATCIAVVAPTSGAHTYKATLVISAGNHQVVSTANAPSFILVEDIGATP